MHQKKRLISIDVLRTFGIVMVMLGHYYYLDIPYYNALLQSVHLPIFFLINGYFISSDWNFSILNKETRSYLLPYVTTCAIILFIVLIKSEDIKTSIIAILWAKSTMNVPYPSAQFANIPRIGAIWFLWALWWSRQFVHFSIKTNHLILLPTIFFFIGIFSFEYIYLPTSIQSGLVASAYVAIGKAIRTNNLLEKRTSIQFIIFCCIMWAGCILYGGVNIAICQFHNIPICFIGSICGVYVMYTVSKKISKAKKLSKIWKVGKISLFILCLHTLDLDEIQINSYFTLAPENKFYINYLLGMCAVTLYMFIVYCVMKQIPFFKSIFKLN